ncbi:MAG: fibronectin type III domain-containing protein, partial [Wenzhouxiangella sp.]|nr:fibronectin type III domain-containing protein [Wenzhouxiangella sp.]
MNQAQLGLIRRKPSTLLVFFAFLAYFLLVIMPQQSYGQSQSLNNVPPTADTYVRADSPNSSYGNQQIILIRTYSGNQQSIAVLRWNLSSIPTNAVVQNVAISFEKLNAGGSSISLSVRPINSSWSENSLTYNGLLPILGPSAVNSVTLSTSPNFPVLAASSGGLVNLVQSWVSNPGSNHGLALLQAAPNQSEEFTFASRRSTFHAPARITVGYTVPTPAPDRPGSISYPSSSSTGNFTVSWGSVSGATRYELQRSANSGSTWSQIFNGNATSQNQSLSNGTYRFRVRACNSTGCSSWR